MDYAQARYYSNVQGRFTSVDPLMASANSGNPKTWNRYAYALNNPYRYIDPTGMEPQNQDYRPEFHGCSPGTTGCSEYTEIGRVTVSPPPTPVEVSDVTNLTDLQIMTGVEQPIPQPLIDPQTASTGAVLMTAGSLAAIDGPAPVGDAIGVGLVGWRLWAAISTATLASGASDLAFPTTANPDAPTDSQLVTYYHYSGAPFPSFAGGLWIGSSATTVSGLDSNTASGGLGIPPPIYEYPVTINPRVTPAINMGPVAPNRYGPGGYPDIYFPHGTPPGSVGVPRLVPQIP